MTIFTAKNILKAYLDCRKTKRKTVNALKYELDLEENLERLRCRLINRTYAPERSICFVVTNPKVREIFAADFADRITHHLLINQVQKIWEADLFINDSYACRKGKGHHYGVERVFAKVKRNNFYGQFDIKNFFSSINKPTLYKIFAEQIQTQLKPVWWKQEVLWLATVIIFNDPTKNYVYKGDPELKSQVPKIKSLFNQNSDTGMPIGNLTSQFLANVYLNELDHFVTEDLGCNSYGRYVDDFIVFSNSKAQILMWRSQIKEFLASKLYLTLHPTKQQIQPTRHGVPFVGYFIKPWGITVRRNVVKNVKNKIYHFNRDKGSFATLRMTTGCTLRMTNQCHSDSFCHSERSEESLVNIEKVISSLNSYYGHFGKAKSAHLRKHLIEKHLCQELKSQIIVVNNWHHLRQRGL